MSSTLYTVYFSSNDECISLTSCEDYAHAEEIFEKTIVPMFLEKRDNNCYRIIKHKDGITAAELVSTFKSNHVEYPGDLYIFVQRRHEVTVYEKVVIRGTLYNSYDVRYVGKIGVLSQKRNVEINGSLLEIQLATCQKTILQQEAIIKALENENALLKSSQVSQVSCAPISSKEVVKRSNPLMGNVIDELKNFFCRNNIAEKCEQTLVEETIVGEVEEYVI